MTDTTPSQTLSTEVVDRLIKANLLRSYKRDALIAKLASGKMTELDWKIEIDLAQGKGGQK